MKIGSHVVRKKYGKDILFEIIDIDNNIYILRGIYIRLIADASLEDLEIEEETRDNTDYESKVERVNGILKGKILHIDGDRNYLKMGEEVYKKLNIPYAAYYIDEKEMQDKITDLLEKHKPDILIITGHDRYQKNRILNDLNSYTNSRYFAETVKKARQYQPDKDNLVIFAGACQSYYELLIACGANFASSPKRENIHALDPVNIAAQISQSSIKEFIDVEQFLQNTYSKQGGIGGIDTRGVARNIYSRR